MKTLRIIGLLVILLVMLLLTACTRVVIRDGNPKDTKEPYFSYTGYGVVGAHIGGPLYQGFKKGVHTTDENAAYITSVDNTEAKTSRHERIYVQSRQKSDVGQRTQEHKNRADDALEKARQK